MSSLLKPLMVEKIEIVGQEELYGSPVTNNAIFVAR
jgi:hypothetical protein